MTVARLLVTQEITGSAIRIIVVDLLSLTGAIFKMADLNVDKD